MRVWCRRPDFRALLPSLLEGEDPEFQSYITQIAHEETRKSTAPRNRQVAAVRSYPGA